MGIYSRMTVLLSAVILFSCNNTATKVAITDSSAIQTKVIPEKQSLTEASFDTLISIGDNVFHIQLWRDTADKYDGFDDDSKNAYLLIQKNNQTILHDSLYAAIPEVDIVDLNFDGKPDLSILKGTGGNMANEFYHWILYDTLHLSFHRIDGIEQLPTVNCDSSGLIISHAFYGEHMNQSYFYINKDFKLADLKEEVETVTFDDTTDLATIAFNKALKKYRQRTDK